MKMQSVYCNETRDGIEMYDKEEKDLADDTKFNNITKCNEEAEGMNFVMENKARKRRTKKTQLKRILLQSVLVLLLLALSVAVIVLILQLYKKKDKNESTCVSVDCVTVSSRLIKTANLTSNPCEDFYKYSCGGWEKSNFLPASEPQWNGFTHLRQKAANIVKRALGSSSTRNHKSTAISKLLNFYQSCMDEKQLEKVDGEPLKRLLSLHSNWPILNNSWSGKDWNQTNAFFANHKLFFSYYHHGRPAPIFNAFVKANDKNSKKHIIEIDEPQFTVVPFHYANNKTRWQEVSNAYKQMIREYIALLGGNSSSSDIDDILSFELELANSSTPSETFRDVHKSYQQLTIGNFTKRVGNKVDWIRYLAMNFEPFGIPISADTLIATRSMKYLKAANNLVGRSSNRTIANYLGWIAVNKYAPFLSKKFRSVKFKFQKAVLGLLKEADRFQSCFETVQDNMDMAVARVFVDAAFPRKKKIVAENVLSGMKNEFINTLQSSDWMDQATKSIALQKARLMINDIGYPEFVRNTTALDDHFKDLQVEKDNYFKNILTSYQWRRKQNLEMITMLVNKRQWDIPPTDVNAYYDVTNNKMVFLAGLMDTPFFDTNAPMSVKYASFGFVVGHETTHGFDDQGRLYDQNGDLNSWWSKNSEKAFMDKAKCIQDQYSNYKSFGLQVNGKQTLGENIADLGGLEIAYRAFKNWERRHGKESLLPGLDLTHDQIFFLTFGQVWCSIYNKEKGRYIVLRDEHSPPYLRVNGPLSNMDEFSRAFNCPAGGKMSRKNKCKMW